MLKVPPLRCFHSISMSTFAVDGIQVGVSKTCVMGLNQNHGQKILLRLRTDDLKGFRKVGAIVG